jgi:hypothetical protein
VHVSSFCFSGVPNHGKRHRTPSEIMRELIAVMLRWFPERKFSFIGDGSYGSHAMAAFGYRYRRRLIIVNRFPADANLFEPPKTSKGAKRRPRVKGKKLLTPEKGVKQTKQKKRIKVSWYGGGCRLVEIVTGTGYWYKSGKGLVPVRWVFVHDCTGTHRDEYFFSTDTAIKPKTVIESYTGRWSIATTFQEFSAHLGVETTRCRSEKSVLRE